MNNNENDHKKPKGCFLKNFFKGKMDKDKNKVDEHRFQEEIKKDAKEKDPDTKEPSLEDVLKEKMDKAKNEINEHRYQEEIMRKDIEKEKDDLIKKMDTKTANYTKILEESKKGKKKVLDELEEKLNNAIANNDKNEIDIILKKMREI